MRRRNCLNTEPIRDRASAATIYTLDGKLIGRSECFEFLEDVRDEIANRFVNVILDLANIERINSTGVGIIAAIHNAASEQGGRVVVVNAPADVERLFTTSNLWSFITACDSVAEARRLVAPKAGSAGRAGPAGF